MHVTSQQYQTLRLWIEIKTHENRWDGACRITTTWVSVLSTVIFELWLWCYQTHSLQYWEF